MAGVGIGSVIAGHIHKKIFWILHTNFSISIFFKLHKWEKNIYFTMWVKSKTLILDNSNGKILTYGLLLFATIVDL